MESRIEGSYLFIKRISVNTPQTLYKTHQLCIGHPRLLIPLLLLCNYKIRLFITKYFVSNCLLGARSWLITLLLSGMHSWVLQSKDGSCTIFQISLMNASTFSTCQQQNKKFLKGLCLLFTNTHGAISQLAGLVQASFLPACSELLTP